MFKMQEAAVRDALSGGDSGPAGHGAVLKRTDQGSRRNAVPEQSADGGDGDRLPARA